MATNAGRRTVNQSQAPLLETRDLSRLFGHGTQATHAVEQVSFSVQPGEIVAVIGESLRKRHAMSILFIA
jgi:ABC-type glutathione transport system ATPase component